MTSTQRTNTIVGEMIEAGWLENDAHMVAIAAVINHTIHTAELDMAERAVRIALKEGLTLYAWWRDGIQYVGTTGTTLAEALHDVEADVVTIAQQAVKEDRDA